MRLHVLERNIGAVALYKKWGFEVVETKREYFIGHPVLRMVKKIMKLSVNRNVKDNECTYEYWLVCYTISCRGIEQVASMNCDYALHQIVDSVMSPHMISILHFKFII